MTDTQGTYEVYIGTPRGLRRDLIDGWSKLTAVVAVNAVGQWSITIPDGLVDPALLQRDAMIEIWRQAPDVHNTLITAGFLRKWDYYQDGGSDMLALYGPDVNELLLTRIVAAGAFESVGYKAGVTADDLMKDIVDNSLGSAATDTDRDLSAYGFTIEADASGGPTVSRSYPRSQVLQVLQEISAAARAAGTRVLFGIMPIPQSDTLELEFRTWITRRGTDRSASSGRPTFFGPEWGNMEAARLSYDYSDEVTVIYAGGQGEGADREVVEVEDTARRYATPWNRREAFANASTQNTTNEITEAARTLLDLDRPRVLFLGTIKDTPQTRYGKDWFFGDTITAEYRGQFDADIEKVRFEKSSGGTEVIEAQVEAVQ